MPYSVDSNRWSNMNIFEQMGNIYSEVGRSFNAKRRGDEAGCQAAIERAIELFDLTTTTLIASKSPKAKEVLRAKETYLKYLYDTSVNTDEINSLDKYFMQFAIAARLNK